jgi:hypothetical protein
VAEARENDIAESVWRSKGPESEEKTAVKRNGVHETPVEWERTKETAAKAEGMTKVEFGSESRREPESASKTSAGAELRSCHRGSGK